MHVRINIIIVKILWRWSKYIYHLLYSEDTKPTKYQRTTYVVRIFLLPCGSVLRYVPGDVASMSSMHVGQLVLLHAQGEDRPCVRKNIGRTSISMRCTCVRPNPFLLSIFFFPCPFRFTSAQSSAPAQPPPRRQASRPPPPCCHCRVGSSLRVVRLALDSVSESDTTPPSCSSRFLPPPPLKAPRPSAFAPHAAPPP